MLRRIFDSSWFYFTLAGLLLVVAIATQVQVQVPSRPKGTVDDIAKLKERDDLNVIFILIDTLRADHLSAYGYKRNTSPIMKELADYGVRFNHVQSQSSWTKASMASMWLGAYPARTGVLKFRQAVPPDARLPAEIFQSAGYETGGVWRNGWVANNFGFSRGFDMYIRPTASRTPKKFNRRSPSAHPLQGTDLDVTQSAIEYIRAQRDERFFLYLHYMDVHQYLYDDSSALFGTRYLDAYDNAIHWTDRNVGLLLSELDELDILKRTVVVIGSDHGEAFFEHGNEGHARNLYREVMEVPLIVVLPFILEPGIVVDPMVANVDIFPTILDLVGLPAMQGTQGRSVVPLIVQAGSNQPPTEKSPPAFAQLDRSWGRADEESDHIVSVVDGDFRMIHQVNHPDVPELYDRSGDPGESQNIAEERPEVVSDLRSKVDQYLDSTTDAWGAAPTVEIDEMRREQLRALGYVVQ